MSKFHVSKKEYLKYASTRKACARPETPDDDDDDEDLMLADLRNERSAKWRREIMKILTNADKKQVAKKPAKTRATLPEKTVRRIDMLAVPRKIPQSFPNELLEPFKVRPSALHCHPSNRIQDLAQPRRLHTRTLSNPSSEQEPKEESSRSYTKRLPYQVSERIKSLAQPRQPTFTKVLEAREPRETPMARFLPPGMTAQELRTHRMARLMELTKIPKHKFTSAREKRPGAVPYSALVCRASPRLEELAGPVIRRQPKQNDYAFRIRPSALRYNPTTRIENLAIARTNRYKPIL